MLEISYAFVILFLYTIGYFTLTHLMIAGLVYLVLVTVIDISRVQNRTIQKNKDYINCNKEY